MRELLLIALVACARALEGHEGHGTPAPDPHAGHDVPASPDPHAGHTASASPEAVAALGVRTAPARAGDAGIARRAPATARFDPARTARATSVTGGQVRDLAAPLVGERVAKGQVLARLWSPEVGAAFAELLVARALGEPWQGAARGRLRNAGVADAEIDAALASGEAPATIAVRAPIAGVVTARPVTEGGWVGAGGVVAEIAPADAIVVEVTVTPAPSVGTRISFGDVEGRVDALLPTATAAGSVVRVAVDAAVPVGRPLVATWTEPAGQGVWVPRSAVVDTGARRVVFVAADGATTPRDVTVGVRTADEVQITGGLAAGEEVVVHGTFLFDADTQMTGPGHAGHGS
jgi:Cu(I)/Ag(I) efflux system membrane fusion protein